jgi:hypothetical protein
MNALPSRIAPRRAQADAVGDGTPLHRFSNISGPGNVDYALRTVQQGLVHFSSMADAKANIMITVCSIVVTVSLTQWNNAFLRAPMIVLAAFGLAALSFAVLSVKPAFSTKGRVDERVDPHAPGFNLLFFGHFSQLSPDQYLDAMDTMLSRQSALYETIIRDMHAQGVVLARKKYRLLGYSYLSFLLGLGASTAILILQSLW